MMQQICCKYMAVFGAARERSGCVATANPQAQPTVKRKSGIPRSAGAKLEQPFALPSDSRFFSGAAPPRRNEADVAGKRGHECEATSQLEDFRCTNGSAFCRVRSGLCAIRPRTAGNLWAARPNPTVSLMRGDRRARIELLCASVQRGHLDTTAAAKLQRRLPRARAPPPEPLRND